MRGVQASVVLAETSSKERKHTDTFEGVLTDAVNSQLVKAAGEALLETGNHQSSKKFLIGSASLFRNRKHNPPGFLFETL